MSAGGWSQAGPPVLQQNQGAPPPPVQRRATNPPPVCFNCGVEGHFLVACPEATRTTPGAINPAPYQPYPVQNPHSQQQHLQHGHPTQYLHPYQQNTPQYGPSTPQHPYGQPPPPQPYGVPQQYPRPVVQPLQHNQYAPPVAAPFSYNTLAYQGPAQQFAPPTPVPYQQAPSPYTPQNASYGGNYQGLPVQHQPYQSKWKFTPPAVKPTYQTPGRSNSMQQLGSGQRSHSLQNPTQRGDHSHRGKSMQRDPSVRRERSQPPMNLMGRQRSRSLQRGRQSQSHHSMTSGSRQSSVHQASRRGSQGSHATVIMGPEGEVDESPTSSEASTPYGSYGRGEDSIEKNAKHVQSSVTSQKQGGSVKPEDGEVGEEDETDAMFKWEYKRIFKEPLAFETVELAQPLLDTYTSKSTPVPLVQAWSTMVPSISRYARKDNLDEFVRPIRSSPQWSYLQEDPAFADIDLHGPAIPFEELDMWIIAHHEETDGLMVDEMEEEEETWNNSRKRARCDEAEGETEVVKRQKNDYAECDQDVVMRAPNATTPVIHRSGTPCDETGDDAWAPLPGESASTPQDPTETFLASLGVTGSAKPVRKAPIPAYMNGLEEVPRDRSSQPAQAAPLRHNPQEANSAPPNTNATLQQQISRSPNHQQVPPAQQGPSIDNQSVPPINPVNGVPVPGQYGPQMANQVGFQPSHQNGPVCRQNGPIHNQYGAQAQYGPPVNRGFGNAQYQSSPAGNYHQGNPQYGPPVNVSYQNGPPQNFGAPSTQYGHGPVQAGPYNNGQMNNFGPQNNYPQQGVPQWTVPQHQAYNHAHPVNGPQVFPHQTPVPGPQYGNSQFSTPDNSFVNGQGLQFQQHGPPQYGPQQVPQQYAQPQGQYSQQRNPSLGNVSQVAVPFDTQTQASPTYQGPPQNGPFSHPQYQNHGYQPTSNHGLPICNVDGPPDSISRLDSPYQQPQPFANGFDGNAPQRQDSGYRSARGSYSNGSEPQSTDAQNGGAEPATQEPRNSPLINVKVHSSPPKTTRETSEGESVPSDSTGTPLSPTSAMILDKLESRKAYGEAKPGEKRKLSQSVVNARKKKGPQPVVAEAYGRRW